MRKFVIFFLPSQVGKLCKFLADFVHQTPLLHHCTSMRNTHKEKTCFGLCTKYIWKILRVQPPTSLITTLALSHCDNLSFQIVTILYFGRQSQCSIKMSQSGKIKYATMWQKIVPSCNQNLLYVTSVTKKKNI